MRNQKSLLLLMGFLAFILVSSVNCPGDGAKFDASRLFSQNPSGNGGDDDDATGDDDSTGDDDDATGDDDSTGDDDDAGGTECTAIATYYVDADGDGFGSASTTDTLAVTSCTDASALAGYVADNTDCDDTDSSVFPGATEVAYYADADGDGFGTSDTTAETKTVTSCAEGLVDITGYVADNTDCDDSNASVFPGGTEILGDGVNQNCEDDVYLAVYRIDQDSDNDGTVDFVQIYHFNSDGTESGHLYDSAPIEPANSDGFYLYTYTDGNVTAKYGMHDGESTPYYTRETFSGYDEAGNWAEQLAEDSCVTAAWPWTSWTCTRDYTNSRTYTYDEAGEITKKVNVRNATTFPVTTTTYYTYTYNESGLIENSQTYIDLDFDGVGETLRASTQFTYDDNGNVLTKVVDSNGDGTTDAEYTYTWQALSPSYELVPTAVATVLKKSDYAKLTETVTNVSAGTTLTLDYTYDEHGVVSSSFKDTNGDGEADEDVISTERTYLSNE